MSKPLFFLQLVLTLLFTCFVATGAGPAWAKSPTSNQSSHEYDDKLDVGTTEQVSIATAITEAAERAEAQQTALRPANKLYVEVAQCAPPKELLADSTEVRGPPVPRGGARFVAHE